MSSSPTTAASSDSPGTTDAVHLGYLRTRVGRRFLVTNLVVTSLLLTAIAVAAEAYVRSALRDEAQARVSRLAKTLSLSTLATLATASRDLEGGIRREATGTSNAATLVAHVVRRARAGIPAGIDDSTTARALTQEEYAHLRGGRPLLVVQHIGEESLILLGHAVLRGTADFDVAWARVNDGYLWGTADESIGGEDAGYCVAERGTSRMIHCTHELPRASVTLASQIGARTLDSRTVVDEGGRFAAARDVYLRYEFGAPEWRVIVLQPASTALAALASFRQMIAVLFVAALALIFLVSHTQIRRTTEPLARLREGTERLQQGDFNAPVIVRSNDEFEDVAQSFNGMARVLDQQFALLRNLDAIDESALAARERDALMREAAARFQVLLSSARVAVAVTHTTRPLAIDVAVTEGGVPAPGLLTRQLSAEERDALRAQPRQFVVERGALPPSYLGTESRSVLRQAVVVLPLRQDDELLGVVSIAASERALDDDASWRDARRMADRVALALRHVQLVHRLNALSAGTITAFARAIDANSPWTAGHSERVTRVAVQIGRELQLSESDLATLERGALLHDIGKIAVPASILDKQGRLTDAEWVVMKRHPVVGCEILGPIPALAETLPLVRSHHERMDGTGYPDRLAGEAIPFLARVLAVADVFDALSSERPYRLGLELPEACQIINESAGAHLDPQVVAAFLDVVRKGNLPSQPSRLDTSTLAAAVAHAREGLLMHA